MMYDIAVIKNHVEAINYEFEKVIILCRVSVTNYNSLNNQNIICENKINSIPHWKRVYNVNDTISINSTGFNIHKMQYIKTIYNIKKNDNCNTMLIVVKDPTRLARLSNDFIYELHYNNIMVYSLYHDKFSIEKEFMDVYEEGYKYSQIISNVSRKRNEWKNKNCYFDSRFLKESIFLCKKKIDNYNLYKITLPDYLSFFTLLYIRYIYDNNLIPYNFNITNSYKYFVLEFFDIKNKKTIKKINNINSGIDSITKIYYNRNKKNFDRIIIDKEIENMIYEIISKYIDFYKFGKKLKIEKNFLSYDGSGYIGIFHKVIGNFIEIKNDIKSSIEAVNSILLDKTELYYKIN